MSKKAYLMALVNVHDVQAYETYKQLSSLALSRYGALVLARGGRSQSLEGSINVGRVALFEFESYEQAQLFYDSPEYQAAKKARAGVADMNFVLVDGI